MTITHSLFKQIMISKLVTKTCDRLWRLLHPKEMRHSRRLWPYVREVKRDSNGSIQHFKVWPADWHLQLTPAEQVQKPENHTGHIILSGPSVKEIDYHQFSMPCVMGVNGSFALRKDYDIWFDYYVIIDNSFVRDQLELTRQIVASDLVLFARVGVLKEINLRLPASCVKCRFVILEEVDTPAYQAKPSVASLQERARCHRAFTLFDAERCMGFSADITQGVFGARTVAYDALQIMVWLGMTEIYFHGLDMGDAATAPRFYETVDNKTSTTLHKNFRNVIEPAFRYAGEYLRNHNINVYNLSLNSALDESTFVKRDWRELA